MGNRTIYLIRHGTTEWIEQGIVHGSLDSPLSEYGRWEAQQAAAALAGRDIRHIYCSPQGRALETAGIIAQKLGDVPITQLDNLREMDMGCMEGRQDAFRKIKRRPLLAVVILPILFTVFGISGERQADLKKRVLQAWGEILSQTADGDIAVVSHGAALNALTVQLPHDTHLEKKKRQNFKTCSITTVFIDDQQQAVIKDINNTKHIAADTNYDN